MLGRDHVDRCKRQFVSPFEGRSRWTRPALRGSERLIRTLLSGGHQYWRLGTALFLHYGPAHLLFNLFALYVLGPALERAIGGIRFLFAIWFPVWARAPGSSCSLLFHRSSRHQASRRFRLRHGRGRRSRRVSPPRPSSCPEARARLQNIIMIIGIQVLFDIYTPQVSMSAHLCGLATGFALGIFL